MIRVTGKFYFKYYSDDYDNLRKEFCAVMSQLSSSNLQVNYNDKYVSVSNDTWSDMYDENYQIATDVAILIDESFYCIKYDEHEIKKFVKTYFEYNMIDCNFDYLYMEDEHIEAIGDGKERNTAYDNFCSGDTESKPINVKTPAKANKNGKEQVGSKRRIFILNEDSEKDEP